MVLIPNSQQLEGGCGQLGLHAGVKKNHWTNIKFPNFFCYSSFCWGQERQRNCLLQIKLWSRSSANCTIESLCWLFTWCDEIS